VDINDVLTSNCMNLTQFRNNLNRFNDSYKHQNYIPKIFPMTDHLTYQIVTWLIFALVLFGLTLLLIWCSNKKEQINPINNSKEGLQTKELETQTVEDEMVIHSEISIQKENEIDDLNAIVNIDQLNYNNNSTELKEQAKEEPPKNLNKVEFSTQNKLSSEESE
jgi:hypothetical protein